MNIRQANLERMRIAIDNAYTGIKWGPIIERDWFSATFTGRRVVVELKPACELARKSARKLLCGIGELDFELEDEFVADIYATVANDGPDATKLRLEALLIQA